MASGIDLSWAWAVGLITFAFGIACGIGIAYLMLGNRRRTQELQDKLDTLQQEFDSYHDQVGQHFLKTSELVQNMTESYRDVYEHLATGSQALCQMPVNTPRLDIPEHLTLETGTQTGAANQKTVARVSEADTGGLNEPDSDEPNADAFLGDAPRIPTLDAENGKGHASSPTTH
ncbi:MAG: DUF1043 family protein [Pseudomonadota bacterium]|nr:DUF1043 family protein [Pseudomonadota bacterium]